jgi:hypothetical protein
MDKNKIKNHLVNRFVNEGTPGIDVTKAILSKSKAFNDEGLKDIEDKLTSAEKGQKKSASKTKEMPQNKFNYENKEAEYHQEMEIMNGSEMLEYDRDPNQTFKERAVRAIEGHPTMGNSPDYANVVPEQMGFTGPTFGKKLVQAIKNSAKKRLKATDRLISFGTDIETVPDNYAPMAKFSAIYENIHNTPQMGGVTKSKGTAGYIDNTSKMDKEYSDSINKPKDDIDISQADISGDNYEKINREIEYGFNIGNLDENEFYDSEEAKNDNIEYKGYKIYLDDNNYYNLPNHKYAFRNTNDWDESLGWGPSVEDCMQQIDDIVDDRLDENKTNNKPQIKEGMKRLKFKQEFKGVGNALKLIPESYKVNNKVFEMTDGVESYRMRWEGNLNEGRAVVLMASDKTMVNEDMQKMKHLMGYKSQETLGTVKGKARIDENKIFSDIWKKSQILIEGEDIEATKAVEKKTDEKLPQAPEARKHVQGSVEKKAEMEISHKSETEIEFDKVDVPQAAEAKKDVIVKKGIKLGESYFAPIDEAWMEEMMHGGMEEGMYEDEEGYDDEEEDTRIDYSMGKTGPNQLPPPPKSIKLDLDTLEEDMYEEGIYESEEIMAAEKIANKIEDVLSPEEVNFLTQAYQQGGKEMIAKAIEKTVNESLHEDSNTEPPSNGEFGMSRNEIKLRQILDKLVKVGSVGSLLAIVPAAMAGAPAVALGLGIAALAGTTLKDVAWWKKQGHHYDAQNKYGVKEDMDEMYSFEESDDIDEMDSMYNYDEE